jgi:Rrf2 family transcriptional regulator, iron-sulfur cluster assembly transcription factor
MLFSTATAYALQALAAMPEDGSFYLAKGLAEELELPGPYLAKILQTLAQEGILQSLRGPKGGFRLALPANEITVGRVLETMEGPDPLGGCIMGLTGCGNHEPCPLHGAWDAAQKCIQQTMTRVTILDLQTTARKRKRALA